MNKTQDLVSILLPVGKDKRFLNQAIESVKQQTYKNLELLIGEDKGKGITKTLIELAKNAKGEYLARMDADDVSEPERLEKQVEYLDNNPEVMLVGSWATLIDESGENIGLQKMPVSWLEIKKEVFKRNPLIHPSWMMRRDWFEKIGGYNSEYRYSQDWELLLRTVWKYRIENIPEPLLRLRIHRQSSSFVNNKQQLWCGIKARWGAIKRGDIQSWKVIYLLPKIISFIIPAKIKYLYRFARYRLVPGFIRLPRDVPSGTPLAMTREKGRSSEDSPHEDCPHGKRKILGVVLPMGQSKKLLVKSGQWGLWASEIEIYKKDFAEVRIFEYRYSDWRRFWEVFLFLFNKKFRECEVFKAVHLTGAIPCFAAKIFWRKKYLLSYGYRYDDFAKLDRKWFQWILIKLLTPMAIGMADAVMVPTEELKKYVERYKFGKVVIIPNGVDLQAFKGPTLHAQGRTLSDLTILFVGRLEKQKNLEILIRALADLKIGDVRLLFVGRGSLKEELIKLADKLNINLEIINSIPNDQLPKIYQKADIFILPSLIEGHPKALLEAMACGLPCVASDISGIRDIIINNENGLLVEPTSEEIIGGLRRLIDDNNLRTRLGETARKTVENIFDKKKLIRKEIQLLQSL